MKSIPKDYRPNVGMMIINQKKEIFVGKLVLIQGRPNISQAVSLLIIQSNQRVHNLRTHATVV